MQEISNQKIDWEQVICIYGPQNGLLLTERTIHRLVSQDGERLTAIENRPLESYPLYFRS